MGWGYGHPAPKWTQTEDKPFFISGIQMLQLRSQEPQAPH